MKSKLHIDICSGRNVAFSELQCAHYQRKTQIRQKLNLQEGEDIVEKLV